MVGVVNVFSSPTPEEYSTALALAAEHPSMHLNFGLQPTHATPETFKVFETALGHARGKVCAVGEVGLDYYWEKDPAVHKTQEVIFVRTVEVANQEGLPLVIHSRKAESACLDVLENHAEVPVLLHGFEGKAEEVKRAVDLGYYVTIPTSVVNRRKYRQVAKRFPLERIMLETDSPFQLPFDPPKGGDRPRNEPNAVRQSCQKIADLLDLLFEDVARQTTQTTTSFFGL